MNRFDTQFNKILRYVLAFFILLMTTAVFSQVVARYVFNHAFQFTEELGRYLFVAISYFGLIAVTRSSGHITMTLLYERMPRKIRRRVSVFNNIVSIIFVGVLCYSSILLADNSNVHNQVSPSLMVPMKYVYVPMIVGSAISVIYLIKNGIKTFNDLSREEDNYDGL